MSIIANLEKLLVTGQDSSLLRYGLGNAYLNTGNFQKAIEHLEQSLIHDPNYTAAWKLYAKTLAQAQLIPKAIAAYQQGIEVAERKGDMQALKEMRVFLKRLQMLDA